jgi:hypothetical protein
MTPRAVQFSTAVMVLGQGVNTSVFADGVTNQMWVHDPSDGGAAAREMGYGSDWWRYITEHDLTHHFVADAIGQPFSYAIHDGNGDVPLCDAPQEQQDEEHLVNRLQRWLMTGDPDPYGQVQRHFGANPILTLRALARLLDSAVGPIGRAVL